MYATAYYGYKAGDVVFVNGDHLTIKSIDPALYSNGSTKIIYIDTIEKGVVAMPVW